MKVLLLPLLVLSTPILAVAGTNFPPRWHHFQRPSSQQGGSFLETFQRKVYPTSASVRTADLESAIPVRPIQGLSSFNVIKQFYRRILDNDGDKRHRWWSLPRSRQRGLSPRLPQPRRRRPHRRPQLDLAVANPSLEQGEHLIRKMLTPIPVALCNTSSTFSEYVGSSGEVLEVPEIESDREAPRGTPLSTFINPRPRPVEAQKQFLNDVTFAPVTTPSLFSMNHIPGDTITENAVLQAEDIPTKLPSSHEGTPVLASPFGSLSERKNSKSFEQALSVLQRGPRFRRPLPHELLNQPDELFQTSESEFLEELKSNAGAPSGGNSNDNNATGSNYGSQSSDYDTDVTENIIVGKITDKHNIDEEELIDDKSNEIFSHFSDDVLSDHEKSMFDSHFPVTNKSVSDSHFPVSNRPSFTTYENTTFPVIFNASPYYDFYDYYDYDDNHNPFLRAPELSWRLQPPPPLSLIPLPLPSPSHTLNPQPLPPPSPPSQSLPPPTSSAPHPLYFPLRPTQIEPQVQDESPLLGPFDYNQELSNADISVQSSNNSLYITGKKGLSKEAFIANLNRFLALPITLKPHNRSLSSDINETAGIEASTLQYANSNEVFFKPEVVEENGFLNDASYSGVDIKQLDESNKEDGNILNPSTGTTSRLSVDHSTRAELLRVQTGRVQPHVGDDYQLSFENQLTVPFTESGHSNGPFDQLETSVFATFGNVMDSSTGFTANLLKNNMQNTTPGTANLTYRNTSFESTAGDSQSGENIPKTSKSSSLETQTEVASVLLKPHISAISHFSVKNLSVPSHFQQHNQNRLTASLPNIQKYPIRHKPSLHPSPIGIPLIPVESSGERGKFLPMRETFNASPESQRTPYNNFKLHDTDDSLSSKVNFRPSLQIPTDDVGFTIPLTEDVEVQSNLNGLRISPISTDTQMNHHKSSLDSAISINSQKHQVEPNSNNPGIVSSTTNSERKLRGSLNSETLVAPYSSRKRYRIQSNPSHSRALVSSAGNQENFHRLSESNIYTASLPPEGNQHEFLPGFQEISATSPENLIKPIPVRFIPNTSSEIEKKPELLHLNTFGIRLVKEKLPEFQINVTNPGKFSSTSFSFSRESESSNTPSSVPDVQLTRPTSTSHISPTYPLSSSSSSLAPSSPTYLPTPSPLSLTLNEFSESLTNEEQSNVNEYHDKLRMLQEEIDTVIDLGALLRQLKLSADDSVDSDKTKRVSVNEFLNSLVTILKLNDADEPKSSSTYTHAPFLPKTEVESDTFLDLQPQLALETQPKFAFLQSEDDSVSRFLNNSKIEIRDSLKEVKLTHSFTEEGSLENFTSPLLNKESDSPQASKVVLFNDSDYEYNYDSNFPFYITEYESLKKKNESPLHQIEQNPEADYILSSSMSDGSQSIHSTENVPKESILSRIHEISTEINFTNSVVSTEDLTSSPLITSLQSSSEWNEPTVPGVDDTTDTVVIRTNTEDLRTFAVTENSSLDNSVASSYDISLQSQVTRESALKILARIENLQKESLARLEWLSKLKDKNNVTFDYLDMLSALNITNDAEISNLFSRNSTENELLRSKNKDIVLQLFPRISFLISSLKDLIEKAQNLTHMLNKADKSNIDSIEHFGEDTIINEEFRLPDTSSQLLHQDSHQITSNFSSNQLNNSDILLLVDNGTSLLPESGEFSILLPENNKTNSSTKTTKSMLNENAQSNSSFVGKVPLFSLILSGRGSPSGKQHGSRDEKLTPFLSLALSQAGFLLDQANVGHRGGDERSNRHDSNWNFDTTSNIQKSLLFTASSSQKEGRESFLEVPFHGPKTDKLIKDMNTAGFPLGYHLEIWNKVSETPTNPEPEEMTNINKFKKFDEFVLDEVIDLRPFVDLVRNDSANNNRIILVNQSDLSYINETLHHNNSIILIEKNGQNGEMATADSRVHLEAINILDKEVDSTERQPHLEENTSELIQMAENETVTRLENFTHKTVLDNDIVSEHQDSLSTTPIISLVSTAKLENESKPDTLPEVDYDAATNELKEITKRLDQLTKSVGVIQVLSSKFFTTTSPKIKTERNADYFSGNEPSDTETSLQSSEFVLLIDGNDKNSNEKEITKKHVITNSGADTDRKMASDNKLISTPTLSSTSIGNPLNFDEIEKTKIITSKSSIETQPLQENSYVLTADYSVGTVVSNPTAQGNKFPTMAAPVLPDKTFKSQKWLWKPTLPTKPGKITKNVRNIDTAAFIPSFGPAMYQRPAREPSKLLLSAADQYFDYGNQKKMEHKHRQHSSRNLGGAVRDNWVWKRSSRGL